MNREDVITSKKQILQHLSKRQLKQAFELLMKLTVNTRDWQASENLNDLETNYKYMLHYFFEGSEDPERENVYNALLRSLYELTDDSADELLKIDSPNLFYDKVRIAELNPTSIKQYHKQLKDISTSISLLDLLADDQDKDTQRRNLSIKRERIDSDMFNFIFASARADEKDVADYTDFVDTLDLPSQEKCLFISALSLNLFHRFDSKKVHVLMHAALSHNVQVRARAIVGLVVVLQMYDTRWALYPELQRQLDTLSENTEFKRTVLQVIIQLIRSRGTETISKKITEEIIPEMMKFNSLAGRKLNMEELMGGDVDFSDKNPEWQKELEDSGLSKKLQEYSSLQMEGADVFHSTFAGLKNYPFFSDLSNWFLPFDASYSELIPLFPNVQRNSIMQSAIVDSGHMCNSDKYSFCLSLLHISSQQREMVMGRMGAESEEIKQMQKDAKELNPNVDEEVVSNQYIQDLYRFFKLNSHRNSFFDIFKLSINFYNKKSIEPLISDISSMKRIALYCFDKNYFEEALAIFNRLLVHKEVSSDVWQKVGYCKQMLDDQMGALNAYLQADLINPGNSWIIRRIAHSYRSLKKYDLALQYYQKAATLNPDNLNIELNIGHCYLELKDYENALNSYFKVELMDANGSKAWRPIAWTGYLLRKFAIAQQYYQLILSDRPNVHDLLNAGHVELCLYDRKKALDLYLRAGDKEQNMKSFITLFEADKQSLLDNGVDEKIFSFIFDQIKYKLD